MPPPSLLRQTIRTGTRSRGEVAPGRSSRGGARGHRSRPRPAGPMRSQRRLPTTPCRRSRSRRGSRGRARRARTRAGRTPASRIGHRGGDRRPGHRRGGPRPATCVRQARWRLPPKRLSSARIALPAISLARRQRGSERRLLLLVQAGGEAVGQPAGIGAEREPRRAGRARSRSRSGSTTSCAASSSDASHGRSAFDVGMSPNRMTSSGASTGG